MCDDECYEVAIKEAVMNAFRVVGTCNGLVLLADDLEDYGYTFVVWNPSIRRYVTLPKSTMRFSRQGTYVGPVGLGYDAVGNDYKVVRLTTLFKKENPCRPDIWPTSVEVYSLAKGIWSTVSPPQCIVLHYSAAQVFVNGALHWMAKHCHWIDEMVHIDSFILTFDVAAESFGEIMLPKGFESEEAQLSTLSDSGDRNSIALFVRNEVPGAFGLEYWVMKEYSEEKSWTKLMVFGPHDRWINVPRVLCFRRSGEVMLLLKDGHTVSLDIVSEEFKHLGMYGGDLSSVHSYEESLVLLERKDVVSY
ncbi:PREDICTED: F-box protein At4g22390-like [Fragaria vesca subsp. vesca]|uniref:F-box protein At4g22390-like n=1 Tax=Fragaria vesca subsp. vesca TaxID=101020 RepID=UPI0002C36904|nr:PREDICTED: F-box protein At4g22390-like [Fragaria vesca subsp. vesca]XP_011458447.1 PREDICTED: F-box protein At4g22390-like [Fragaria vesca subsp. vesca]